MSVGAAEPDPTAAEEWQRVVEIERQRCARLRQLRAAARPRLKRFLRTTCLLVGGWLGAGLAVANWDFGPWPEGRPNWITRQLFYLAENIWVWWVLGGLLVFVIVNHLLNEARYRWRSPIEIYDAHSPEHALQPWER